MKFSSIVFGVLASCIFFTAPSENAFAANPTAPSGVNSRSGLGDGTNPGVGQGRVNSPNSGTDNPNNAQGMQGGHVSNQSETHLVLARTGHRLVKLTDGRVLIVGGVSRDSMAIAQCEIYDPSTKLFSLTGSLVDARIDPAVVLLKDGRVLAVGGDAKPAIVSDLGPRWGTSSTPLATCEIFDPARARWSRTGDLNHARRLPEAILLKDGKVFVSGGVDTDSRGDFRTNLLGDGINGTELFDPSTGLWTEGPSMLSPGGPYSVAVPGQRWGHRMVILPDGRVLIAGGFWRGPEVASIAMTGCDIYDPITNSISAAAPMNQGRARFGLVDIGGRILAISGLYTEAEAFPGATYFGTTNKVELYDPQLNHWDIVRPMAPPGLFDFSVISPDTDLALVFGGATDTNFSAGSNDPGIFFIDRQYLVATADVSAYHNVFNTWNVVGELQMRRSFPFSNGSALVVDVGFGDFFLCGGIAAPDQFSRTPSSLEYGIVLDSAERFNF